MELAELAAYAEEKYHIREQRRWSDFPGFSVLCDPRTGRWIALLMRQWDGERGVMIERCDLKCGSLVLRDTPRPWLGAPLRMQGTKWVGVAFDESTEPDLVRALFDRAAGASGGKALSAGILSGSGATIVLDSVPSAGGTSYKDTPLPFSGSSYRPEREALPERLRRMRRLYEYGGTPREERVTNFYRQAKFMEDYEDDAPWTGGFVCYYPTYHDMNTGQLRGYFAWRTKVRRGEYLPIPVSAACIYLYELLNGIGASSPEDTLRQLTAFEAGFLDAGYGNESMRRNLRRWKMEFAVLSDLSAETARAAAPHLSEYDSGLAALRYPDAHSDAEVFAALCRFGGKKTALSPVLTADAARGAHLFAEAWRRARSGYRWNGCDPFTLCFGERTSRPWFPLSNALVYPRFPSSDREFVFDDTRLYRCRGGVWAEDSYPADPPDLNRLKGFLHQAEAKLRRHVGAGRSLREKREDAWADPFIDAAVAEDAAALREARRPKITIDLSDLERIRSDAAVTRDSLLTEEELREASPSFEVPAAADAAPEDTPLPLDAAQIDVLRALLRGERPEALIRERHMLPSLTADMINEALFDDIGDTVLICEDDKLSLVEDYRDDLALMLEGVRP